MTDFIREVGTTTLLGTVHASHNSRDDVQSEITENPPDVVAVELNPPRHQKMANSTASDDSSVDLLDLGKSVLNGNLTVSGAVVNYLFVKQQAKVFSALNIRPGEADMLPAINSAEDAGSQVALVDSDISGAMNGLGTSLSPKDVLSHLWSTSIPSLLSSYSTLEEITSRNEFAEADSFEEGVSKLEKMPYDDLEKLLAAYETLLPDGTLDGLVRTRNKIMAGHIYWLNEQGLSVTAVMGRMHVPGVEQYLRNPETIPQKYVVEPPYVKTKNVS